MTTSAAADPDVLLVCALAATRPVFTRSVRRLLRPVARESTNQAGPIAALLVGLTSDDVLQTLSLEARSWLPNYMIFAGDAVRPVAWPVIGQKPTSLAPASSSGPPRLATPAWKSRSTAVLFPQASSVSLAATPGQDDQAPVAAAIRAEHKLILQERAQRQHGPD